MNNKLEKNNVNDYNVSNAIRNILEDNNPEERLVKLHHLFYCKLREEFIIKEILDGDGNFTASWDSESNIGIITVGSNTIHFDDKNVWRKKLEKKIKLENEREEEE